MAEKKQLVLVVENTAALAPYWATIISDSLEKIIWSFCGDVDSEANSPIAELALVNYPYRDSYSPCSVQRSGWTNNFDDFMELLCSMDCNGYLYRDAAIAKGLSEVLKMFPCVNGNQNYQRHCILVATSDRLPEYCGMQSGSRLCAAETVAKYFKQCLVSLSVICPRKLPKLEAIYNAAKRNPSETDPTIDVVKNPDFLVLISEDFMEARVAISQPDITNLLSNQRPTVIDITQESSPVSGPSSTSQEILQICHVQNSKPVVNATITNMPTLGKPNVSDIITVTMTSSVPVAKTVTSSGRAESAKLPWTSTGTTVPTDVATNVGPAQETSSALQPKYVELWEGDLVDESTQKQRQPVAISRLKGYRDSEDSESLAKDWPSTMKVHKLVPIDDVKKEKYKGNVNFVFFQAVNKHSFLRQMQEKKLFSVVKLPSQTLLLCTKNDKPWLLLGMLFPQDMVI